MGISPDSGTQKRRYRVSASVLGHAAARSKPLPDCGRHRCLQETSALGAAGEHSSGGALIVWPASRSYHLSRRSEFQDPPSAVLTLRFEVDLITEQAFDDVDAPVERITGANAPTP